MISRTMMKGPWNPSSTGRRVILFGPELAGKSEILGAFAREEALGLSGYVAGVPPVNLVLALEGAHYSLAAIVGAVWCPDEWCKLVEWSTHVLYVLDPQRPRAARTAELLRQFGSPLEHGRVRAVQVTKQDIVRNQAFATDCFEVGDVQSEFGLAGLPVFDSSIFEPETMTRGVRYLLGAA